MTILALYSNKGGVGKTAAAVNLAYLAANSGKTTLLVDLDAQASATYYLRVRPRLKRKARGLAKPGKSIERSIKGSDYENLDLLPADFEHRNLAIDFDQLKQRKHRLDLALDPLREQYDLIVVDCPPTLSILAENVFNLSDLLLIPLVPTTLSVRAHEQLLAYFGSERPGRDRTAAFLSMVDRRKKLHRELCESLPSQVDGLLQSAIPYAAQVEQMGQRREPVPVYAPRSSAAVAYANLWRELAESRLV